MEIIFIIILIFFLLAISIKPFKLWLFPVNIFTGSLFIIIFLFLFQIIDLDIIKMGVIGDGRIEPWKIIVIFFTLAYASISLDETGILDYISYKIIHKSQNNGVKLFIFFYLLAGLLTIFTSNDVVILTLTPIIFYLGRYASINIIPILFAQFFGANTFSTLLFIGNKTNIIIGSAANLGFLEYTKIMWLPTVIAVLFNLIFLYLFFRKDISKKFKLNEQSRFLVKNWWNTILKTSLIVLMLVILIFSEKLGLPIWIITSFFALLFIILDVFPYLYNKIKNNKNIDKNIFLAVNKKMPWMILPFVMIFFIIIAQINSYGLVDWLAINLSNISNTLEKGILINGIIGFLLANIVNNQPMSILFSNIFINDGFQVSDTIFKGSVYAVILASNLGANLTVVGALAGLMWGKILKDKGLKISYLEFLKVGLIISPIVLIFSLITLFFVLSRI